jgi:predicted aspartyl protease
MSTLYKEVELVGAKGRTKELVLFDTGASYSIIEEGLANTIADFILLDRPMRFETAKAGEILQATHQVAIAFYLEGYRLSDEFIVIPNLSEKVIIGVLTLQKWRIKLDFEHDQVIVDPRAGRLIFK